MKSIVHHLLFVASVLLLLNACSQQASAPTVTHVITEISAEKDSLSSPSGKMHSITASITVNKTALLNQEFLYGADVQHSSIFESRKNLYVQSAAMGHIPVFFRINGKELQLIADNRRLYASDVNRPERLVSRFEILSETENTLTLSEANSAEFLVTTIDPSAESPRDHWARSLEFVQDGNYLLQESSVVMKDGSIVEVMESVFPRATLAASSSFHAIEMNPEDPKGGLTASLAKYRFLNSEPIFYGEQKFAYGQHFDIGDGKTIDWYVTSNIKDEELPIVRDALEGWNRYFKTFKGIGREVVRFMGRLPEGKKIGDPRYNVINWDNKRDAGAAFESQASDPFSGKQSHSLIYMPVAWFDYGMNYWAYGNYSEDLPQAESSKSGFKSHCMRDLKSAADALHSGRMSEREARKFAVQLMKQTLFHEVGHALGLAHNFKGSLTFDRSNPKSPFSSSIMDYNDSEIERSVFFENSSDGPLLEYDRQALSAIYNQMKDVSGSDEVMPVCSDDEADTETSGAVDPLCVRYDIENNPTLSVTTALKRIQESSLENDVSLSEALMNVKEELLSSHQVQAIDTQEKLKIKMNDLRSAISGVMRFYFMSGEASLEKSVRRNIRSLYVFQEGVLPVEVSELAMRTRAFDGVKSLLGMMSLSDAVNKGLDQMGNEAAAALLKAPALSTLNSSQMESATDSIRTLVNNCGKRFEMDQDRGLPKARKILMGALVRKPKLPFFFGVAENMSLDFESATIALLSGSASNLVLHFSERLLATKALVSFNGRPGVAELLAQLRTQVEIELKMAKNNEAREFAVQMQELLTDKTRR